MHEGYTEQDRQSLWEHEAIVREIILGQGAIHVADIQWHRVLSPPEHFQQWPYPAIAAIRNPDIQDYAILVTKAAALVGNPQHIRILGFDSTEARAMGLDLEAALHWPLSTETIGYRLKHSERGAYYCFYVTHDGYLTDEQPPPETYSQIPTDDESTFTLRALAAWRNTAPGVIPSQKKSRLIPAGDLRPFLPY